MSKMVMDTAFCHSMEEREIIPNLTQNESSLQDFSFLMSLISQKHMTKEKKEKKMIPSDFVWAQK